VKGLSALWVTTFMSQRGLQVTVKSSLYWW